MVNFVNTLTLLPFYSISAGKVKRQADLSASFSTDAMDAWFAQNFNTNSGGDDSDTTTDQDFSHQTEKWNALVAEAKLNGFGDDMDCPVLPDLQAGGANGFAGECTFPSMSNSSNYFRVYEDCHGNALPSSQEWYASTFDFAGKATAMWHAPSSIDTANVQHGVCTDPSMPIGSHPWCPNSDLENQWMWHHHPEQPFHPYPSVKGLWTGISRPSNPSTDYFCDNDRYVQTFFDWGVNEPNLAKSRFTMLYYMSSKMMDLRSNNQGAVYCEVNCAHLRPCEALNCEANNAVCTDNGDEASSFCTCNELNYTWDRATKTCVSPVKTWNIPASMEGMRDIMQAVFDDGSGNARRKRSVDAVFDDIMTHGCHCVKMEKDFTGLGGRTTVDTMDGLCQAWSTARRCITLQGGSCEGVDLSIDTYQVEINSVTKEMNCTINDSNGSTQCLKDNCYIDTLNMQFLLGELSNSPSWAPIAGDSTLCPKCNNCVPPAACSGTAPNVEPISWLDFNANGFGTPVNG